MVTIFTPTYNRRHIIEQLYQSLRKQSSYNFEWIIIDDGSTDNTRELVERWKTDEKLFPIHFLYQKNGGKHRAINRGVQLAKGEAFFIVDSDDFLENDAIRLIEEWWKDIADDSSFAGVAGLCARTDGGIVGGNPLFDQYVDATNLERTKCGLDGDKAEVYKTSILKRYPFPEFEGENFVTEAVIWDKIAYEGLKIRWYNRIIYICEYREDGLSHYGMKKFHENPRGWGLYIHQNRKFGRTNEVQDAELKLDYYVRLHVRLSDEEFLENLKIDRIELDYIRRYINNTIQGIGSNIAIYGLGTRGQHLLKLYNETAVKINYVLDQNMHSTEYAQFGIDEDLPDVDAIIITPKLQQSEIYELLKKRTKVRLVSYDEWKAIAMKE